VITEKKVVDAFGRFSVLSAAELEARKSIFLEQFTKQLLIEANTLVSLCRQHVSPAALRHQHELADALNSLGAAGVDCPELRARLEDFNGLFSMYLSALRNLEQGLTAQHPQEIEAHAGHLAHDVRPAMMEVRRLADDLENEISDDYWTLPTYREMLFIK
jgi:glutamine synthetase